MKRTSIIISCITHAKDLIARKNYAEAQRSLSTAIEIISEEWPSGPPNEREEITGLSGPGGKNRNFGNTGFSGGCTKPLH